jgi:hypothetical protein
VIKGTKVQISTLSIPAIAVPLMLPEGEFVVTLALRLSK